MASLTIKVFGFDCTIELDSDGHIESLSEFPIVLREELLRRVRIVRHDVILPRQQVRPYLRGRIDGVDCTGRTVGELLEAYDVRVGVCR